MDENFTKQRTTANCDKIELKKKKKKKSPLVFKGGIIQDKCAPCRCRREKTTLYRLPEPALLSVLAPA